MSQTQAQQQARTESWQNIGGATLMGGVSGAVAGIGGYGAGKLKTKISPEELKWYEGFGYTEKDVARTPKVMTDKEIAELNTPADPWKQLEMEVTEKRRQQGKSGSTTEFGVETDGLTEGQNGGIMNQIKGYVINRRFSPVAPSSRLNKEVASSFTGATYSRYVLTIDTIMYRISGGSAGKIGRYLSRTPQNGGLQSQLDLALNPAWGNTTERVGKVIVPKGTIIYEGSAAPQNLYDSMGNIIGTLPGGGNQIYINKVKERWFQ